MRLIATTTVVAALAVALAPGAVAQEPLPSPAVLVNFTFVKTAGGATFKRITLQHVPDGSSVVVRCLTRSGERCPGKLHKVFRRDAVMGGELRVTRFEGKRLKTGRRLEATISNAAYATQVKTFRIKKDGTVSVTNTCSQPGSTERTSC